MTLRRTPLQRKTPLRSKTGLKAKSPMKRSATRARSAGKRTARAAGNKIRESARGQPCEVRVLGVCNSDPATVVLAHLNGAGTGIKAHDIHGAYACSACHAWLDGGYVRTSDRETRDLYHLQGMVRTQLKLLALGLISTAPHSTAPMEP